MESVLYKNLEHLSQDVIALLQSDSAPGRKRQSSSQLMTRNGSSSSSTRSQATVGKMPKSNTAIQQIVAFVMHGDPKGWHNGRLDFSRVLSPGQNTAPYCPIIMSAADLCLAQSFRFGTSIFGKYFQSIQESQVLWYHYILFK